MPAVASSTGWSPRPTPSTRRWWRWRPTNAASELAAALPECEIRAGDGALASLATEADVVVNGVVGFAGLPVTLATLEAGRRLALANKESLIAAGPVVQRARRTPGAELVPVDSEHGAIHQCLRANDNRARVERLVLTASGGPFRGRSRADLESVTIDQALAHPTWSMGPKITVDSSTLMNKGLEVIEAHELFGAPAADDGVGIGFDDIEVVVHPQSIVHSMVDLHRRHHHRPALRARHAPAHRVRAGLPRSHHHPVRSASTGRAWATSTSRRPDLDAFPCLRLAYEAGRLGGTVPAWLNAANEVAVAAFLEGRIRWTQIAEVLSSTLDLHDGTPAADLPTVVDLDGRARAATASVIERIAS